MPRRKRLRPRSKIVRSGSIAITKESVEYSTCEDIVLLAHLVVRAQYQHEYNHMQSTSSAYVSSLARRRTSEGI